MASSSKRIITVSKSENHDFFPEDKILTRLPVKSLSRFKCVSKPWLQIISSTRFVKSHLLLYSHKFPRIMLNFSYPHDYLMHCSTHSLFSKHHVTDAIEIDFPADDNSVIGSCNGLLCLFVGTFIGFDMFLWNPCTRKHKRLPPANVNGDMVWAAFGLGYNESNDEYLVLVVSIMGTGRFRTHVKLYSSRTDSWKRIGDFTYGHPVYDIFCKFVAGKFHLPTCPADSYDVEIEDFPVLFDIVSFDIENEGYGMVEQPDYGVGVVALSLEELGGRLCVLCNKKTQADVWVLNEYGVVDSWTKKVTIPYNFIYSRRFSYSKPLIISQSGEILLLYRQLVVNRYQHHFVVYDLNGNRRRVPETRNFGTFEEADVYVESLAWPTMDLVEQREG